MDELVIVWYFVLALECHCFFFGFAAQNQASLKKNMFLYNPFYLFSSFRFFKEPMSDLDYQHGRLVSQYSRESAP